MYVYIYIYCPPLGSIFYSRWHTKSPPRNKNLILIDFDPFRVRKMPIFPKRFHFCPKGTAGVVAIRVELYMYPVSLPTYKVPNYVVLYTTESCTQRGNGFRDEKKKKGKKQIITQSTLHHRRIITGFNKTIKLILTPSSHCWLRKEWEGKKLTIQQDCVNTKKELNRNKAEKKGRQ